MKSFLEEYGFAILAAIVVIVLILMVSPVGRVIQNSMNGIITSFAEQAEHSIASTDNRLQEMLQDLDDDRNSADSVIFTEEEIPATLNILITVDMHSDTYYWDGVFLPQSNFSKENYIKMYSVDPGSYIVARVYEENGKVYANYDYDRDDIIPRYTVCIEPDSGSYTINHGGYTYTYQLIQGDTELFYHIGGVYTD